MNVCSAFGWTSAAIIKLAKLCLGRRSRTRRPRALIRGAPRELLDLLDGVGWHDQVAVVRLERWLRARGYDDEADCVAQMAAA